MAPTLDYEMTFAERIEGPLGTTIGSPARLCWQITEASLRGDRISASIAGAGTDWIRVDNTNIRRQDQRIQFHTDDGALILMRYDTAVVRGDEQFASALAEGRETSFEDSYLRMAPQFEVGSQRYAWLTESLFVGCGRLAGDRRIEYQIYRVC